MYLVIRDFLPAPHQCSVLLNVPVKETMQMLYAFASRIVLHVKLIFA